MERNKSLNKENAQLIGNDRESYCFNPLDLLHRELFLEPEYIGEGVDELQDGHELPEHLVGYVAPDRGRFGELLQVLALQVVSSPGPTLDRDFSLEQCFGACRIPIKVRMRSDPYRNMAAVTSSSIKTIPNELTEKFSSSFFPQKSLHLLSYRYQD